MIRGRWREGKEAKEVREDSMQYEREVGKREEEELIKSLLSALSRRVYNCPLYFPRKPWCGFIV